MNKEKIYDEQISPLITQIIDICKNNKIAMVMQFAIPSPENDDLLCSSTLVADEYNPPKHMVEAATFLRNAGQATPITITTRDKKKDIISQSVFL